EHWRGAVGHVYLACALSLAPMQLASARARSLPCTSPARARYGAPRRVASAAQSPVAADELRTLRSVRVAPGVRLALAQPE
ncbi:unnamed protein product, partial [Closterium sp. Naga37s-1]